MIDACAEHGDRVDRAVAAQGGRDRRATRRARRIDDAGLTVSSLCRGGFFARRRARDEDNRRAVEEAAALGTDVLVLVCGPPAAEDLGAARGT